MTNTPAYQNVMSRMVTGHYAYHGATHVCLDKDNGVASGGECAEDLESVIRGACNLNFVAIRYVRTYYTCQLLWFQKHFVVIPHDAPAGFISVGDLQLREGPSVCSL